MKPTKTSKPIPLKTVRCLKIYLIVYRECKETRSRAVLTSELRPHRCSKTCFWCFFRTQHRFLTLKNFLEKIFSKKFLRYGIFPKGKNHRDFEKSQSLWFFTWKTKGIVVFQNPCGFYLWGKSHIEKIFWKKFFLKFFFFFFF